MDSKFSPVSIDIGNSEQIFTVEWADGHVSNLPLFGLRKNCPCVTCRGGHEMMGRYEPGLFLVQPTRTYMIVSAEPVGNHALKIQWDDGHNTGMYKWELLRHMDETIQKLRAEAENKN
ncbi:MAG: DUF971 domain-containing protein [Balneolaceae bacterium]|nr:MAG: DUF971 domain-containing protein [Balneolaceae bacterium]